MIKNKLIKKLKKLDEEQLKVKEILYHTWYYRLSNEHKASLAVDNFIRDQFSEWFYDNKKYIKLCKEKELKELCRIAWWDASVNFWYYGSTEMWQVKNPDAVSFFSKYHTLYESLITELQTQQQGEQKHG